MDVNGGADGVSLATWRIVIDTGASFEMLCRQGQLAGGNNRSALPKSTSTLATCGVTSPASRLSKASSIGTECEAKEPGTLCRPWLACFLTANRSQGRTANYGE